MKLKLFFIALVSAVALSSCKKDDPVVRGTTGSLTWELSDGTLTIGGEDEMPDYGYPDGRAPWCSYGEAIGRVLIGEGVTTIGACAFYECAGLTGIPIPQSVTGIGMAAFGGCYGLKSIAIPASVTLIGQDAFYDCRDLASIEVAAGNPDYVSEGGVLFDKPKTELICYPAAKQGSDYTIPGSVTYIGDNAFDYADIESITIPENVTDIGASAFTYCFALRSATCLADTPPSLGTLNFIGLPETTLYVPEGSVVNYMEDDAWSAAFRSIEAIR